MQVLQEMGQDPTTCGCYLRRTHGLPCAHELQYYIINGYSIPLDQIHDYWKKLDIQFPIFPNDAADGSPTPPNPVRRALFEEVPDITAPPTAKKKTKGKKLSSLRVPSAWERVVKQYGFKKSPNKKGPGRVASISASQGSPMSTSQRTGPPVSPSSPNPPCSRPPMSTPSSKGTTFIFKNSVFEREFPPYIRKYIDQCTDVAADGNCGFRAVALAIYGTEDDWVKVRQDLVADLQNRSALYARILGGRSARSSNVTNLIQSIAHYHGPADDDYWMAVPDCGHVIATTYNVVFMTFSEHGGNTCLPAILDETQGPPTRKVVCGHLSNDHWILLHMKPGDHPVPPIAFYWNDHHDKSADGLDAQFAFSISHFNRLHNEDGERRASTRRRKNN
ncbi:uncharacterized protein LOC109832304 [Asparagus officinalis]|uniref:uncharacterized protein LOC109832304 n=1 Tax=Asparagus officinalis TaxID=4686 RepID=UPI00098E2B33|nr:uncharacterized protein LOC109832304 [Asparagus officinalis]